MTISANPPPSEEIRIGTVKARDLGERHRARRLPQRHVRPPLPLRRGLARELQLRPP